MIAYEYAKEVAHLVTFAREGAVPPPPGQIQAFLDYTHFEFGPGPDHSFLFAWCYLKSDRTLYLFHRGKWFLGYFIDVNDIGKTIADNLEAMPAYENGAKGLGVLAETIAESQQKLRIARETAKADRTH
jgi:hypothetical protein